MSIDIDSKDEIAKFAKSLGKFSDGSRISKALSMLRRDKNMLFIERVDQGLRAVVLSQTDPARLNYATALNDDGSFFCGTQNLRPCGGLRGKVCKHILLTGLAAIKSTSATTEEVIKWLQESVKKTPFLDKTEATRVLAKFKDAQDGKLEWRAVELVPEDFMAF